MESICWSHVHSKGNSKKKCSLGKRDKVPNQNNRTVYIFMVRSLIFLKFVFSPFKAQKKYMLIAHHVLSCLYIWICYSLGLECLYLTPHLQAHSQASEKFRSHFSVKDPSLKRSRVCAVFIMSTFLYFLASSFCSSVICPLHHCQRNIAKIQIWSCLSPAQKYLISSKCLWIYKIKYVLPGTWEAFKAFHDSSPAYFPHLSSIMYVFASYTGAIPALTIHTHNSLSACSLRTFGLICFHSSCSTPRRSSLPIQIFQSSVLNENSSKVPLRMNAHFQICIIRIYFFMVGIIVYMSVTSL